MTLELSPLAAEHAPAAADLLDQWYVRARRSLPHLSGRDAGFSEAHALVEARRAESGSVSAVAARRDGDLAGFLVASPVDLRSDERSTLYGHPRSALVGFGGSAAVQGREPEVLLALYAHVAARLVDQRRLVHYVQMPADDTVALAWFRLGFGLEQIRGLMPIKARGRQPRGVGGLTIRRAGPGDLPQVGRMAVEVARYHRGTAMFLPQSDTALAALRGSYAGALADPRSAAWIAVRGGEEVGMVLLTPARPGPVVPASAVDLSEAWVEPTARGEGVSRVLLATALAWAYDTGYRFVTAGWRTASPLAAGHWPKVGFKPVAYRLSRVLDQRLTT